MKQPLVSIVTPTLNRKDLLERVLRCMEEQTYRNIEHIVVDGGSDDGTVDMLKQLQRDGLRWVSEPDEGIYNAVNKGFKMARGDVFAYLNTDDLYFPYSVECAVECLESNPEAGFVYGDMVRFDEVQRLASIVFHPELDLGALVRGQIIAQPVVFWRKTVTEHLGGLDEELTLAADHEYWRRMATSFKGRRLDEVLACEGIHGNRLTSGPDATKVALAELEIVRSRFDPDAKDPMRRRIFAVRDRIRHALSVRSLLMRFLFCSLHRVAGPPGSRWQGFFGYGRFQVRWKDSLGAFLPKVGRRFDRSTLEPSR